MKKRGTQLLAMLLVVVMMTSSIVAYGATSNQVADEIISYFDTFTAEEITEIQSVSGKIDALSDADWETILNDSTYPLLTDEAVAKFASEEEAAEKLKSLASDTAKLAYSVYSKDVLVTALDNFKANQSATLQTLFGSDVTPDLLISLVKDAKSELKNIDLGDSSTNSELYKIVYGDEANYIDGVESLANKAFAAVLDKPAYAGLKSALAAAGYNEHYPVNISRLVDGQIEGADTAKALIYNSIMSKNIEVTENGSPIQNASIVNLGTVGSSKQFQVTIFGQNVSAAFGANIPLSSDSKVKITTGESGAYFELSTTASTSEQIQIRRGKGDSSELVEQSNVLFYFTVRSQSTPGGGGGVITPTSTPTAVPSSAPSAEPTDTPSDTQFPDIENHWAKDSINLLVEAGVVDGYDDGSFQPDHGVSRAELSKMIAEIFDLDTSDNSVIFGDSANHWANAVINACAKAGFVNGFDDTTFGPDVVISREQLVTIVGRTFEWNGDVDAALAEYPDFAAVADYAKPYMAAAIEMGVIQGYEDGTIQAQNTITRAEACTILTRAYNDKLQDMIGTDQ